MTEHVVMIIDDDDDIRETLVDVIADEGYRVLSAANGKEALDVLARETAPCVILLDLMMPVMDGWKFRDAQRADVTLVDIPVVVITASGQTNGPLGKVEVLKKPLRIDDVLAKVHAHCPLT